MPSGLLKASVLQERSGLRISCICGRIMKVNLSCPQYRPLKGSPSLQETTAAATRFVVRTLIREAFSGNGANTQGWIGHKIAPEVSGSFCKEKLGAGESTVCVKYLSSGGHTIISPFQLPVVG
ncbi:hypothetical protein TNIN_275251 [Trichonephila inaurata madagascariensis]|uniref:Uncharacterized protein n=1 Tax=Trichonephila inaurata madagascariensis TaxID=2747483 RepID=A0A8X6WN66_9ARAC|nr:hypothetical protein TNIN_275251 [Trichonephila inaurata madagascariensis]